MREYEGTRVRELMQAQQIDEEFLEEMRGIVEAVGYAEADWDLVLLAHIKYELGFTQPFAYRQCTGIVAAMENGTVVQGRNLDLDTHLDWARNSMLEVTFWRGGEALFTGPTTFGLVGLHSAMRFGGWSVQQNTRWDKEKKSGWIAHSIESAKQGGRIAVFEIRKLMQTTADFKVAVSTLAGLRWTAPNYYILAGAKPYQGAVITVGRRARPDVNYLKKEWGRTFLVQTNDDWWAPQSDDRRDVAVRFMTGTARRKVGQDSVWAAMRKPPVCNEGTWFTWMAVPALNASRLTADMCPH